MIKTWHILKNLYIENYFLSHKTLTIISGNDVEDIIISFSGVSYVGFPTTPSNILEITQGTFEDLPKELKNIATSQNFDGDKVFFMKSLNNIYYIVAGNCTITTIKEINFIQTIRENSQEI